MFDFLLRIVVSVTTSCKLFIETWERQRERKRERVRERESDREREREREREKDRDRRVEES